MNRELAITTVVSGLAQLAHFVPMPAGYRYEFDAARAARCARARPQQRSIVSCFVADDDPRGEREVAVVVDLLRTSTTISRGRQVRRAFQASPAKDFPDLFDALVTTLPGFLQGVPLAMELRR